MAKVGSRTLRWAQGPGRQSLFWALAAAAVAALPFLDTVRPACGETPNCELAWDRLFFLPNLLFIPAVTALAILAGSVLAQWGHARFDHRFWTRREQSETLEIPPGHLKPIELERDMTGRSLRWMGLGGLAAAGILGYMATTAIGRRACDPFTFDRPTGLQVCQGPAQWSDMLIAFEVWVFIIGAALLGATMLLRSRRFRAPRKRLAGKAVAQAHP